MSLERWVRPTLLRVEVPVALDTGSVQLLIGTPAGQVAGQSSNLVCVIFRWIFL